MAASHTCKTPLACVWERCRDQNDGSEWQVLWVRHLVNPDAAVLRYPQGPQRLMQASCQPCYICFNLSAIGHIKSFP